MVTVEVVTLSSITLFLLKKKRWEYNRSNLEFGMTFQIKTKIYTNVDDIINT